MSGRIKFGAKCLGVASATVLALSIAAPYLPGDRYSGRIQRSLEAALGRRVELGAVRFSLLPAPGLSLRDVEIEEDPGSGREPFAYVKSLTARPRLWPLIAGRLEFASLRLDDTSVNLTRVESDEGSAWNFARLLHRTKLADLPAIHLRSGRINFKFGDVKSVFYITQADLDARAARGAWQLRFTGQPARTDRPARGFGNLSASGEWRQTPGTLNLDFQLEKSAMNDMIGLIYGRDIGVHGLVSARARLAGPPANLHINGALNIEDVHRWDLLPQRGTGWPFEFEGRLNVPAERLEVDSHSAAKEAPPLSVRFRVADYLSRPHWGVALNWNRFRLEPLLQLARHLGAPLPAGLKMEGTLDGAISYAEQGSWQGQLAFRDAAVTIPDSPPVRFEQAKLLFDGRRVYLPAAMARTSGDDLASIKAAYGLDTGALELEIATDSMVVASLRSQALLAAVPVLDQVQSGTWKGKLRFEGAPGSAGAWSGAIQLEDAAMPIEGVAEPVRIQSARVQLDGARVALEKMHASVGDVTVEGEYRYEPGAVKPHQCRVAIRNLDAAELERLLTPTLQRNRGLIARAFGFGRAPVPEWLSNRRMDGTIEIGALELAGLELTKLRARLIWSGTSVALADITGGLENGSIGGRLTVDLRGNDPAYHLASRLNAVEWGGGKFDGEAALDASGMGDALLTGLRSEGSFAGQSFEEAPLNQFESVAGCYVLDWARRAPHLRFTDLRISTGTELYLGRGAMQEDGRLLIQVSNGTRQLSVTGTLAEMRLDEGASQ